VSHSRHTGPTQERRVTLTDVAVQAGVSPTTASYILNGRSSQMRISQTTQQRVRTVAERLGYRPNRQARGLRTATTATYGMISDFVATGQFAGHMLSGANAAARATQHLLVIGETEGDPESEMRLVEEMVDMQVDGFLYATLVAKEVTLPAVLRSQRVVLVNCTDPASGLPSVLPDDRRGGMTAADLLHGAVPGADVFVVGREDEPGLAGRLRMEGLVEALGATGRRLAGVVPCAWDVASAHQAVGAWLASGATPRAVVCMNDRVAMGTVQAFAAHGLRVPADVSLVSFDGSELAEWLRPPVSSIALPHATMGETAVHLLSGARRAPGDGRPTLVPMPVRAGGSLADARASRGRESSAMV
jgi:LacI family transcriptional regulator